MFYKNILRTIIISLLISIIAHAQQKSLYVIQHGYFADPTLIAYKISGSNTTTL